MVRRSVADQIWQLARARSGADMVMAKITGPVHLERLEAELACWFMVDHTSRRAGHVLIETGPKTVYAATTQARLDAVLKAHKA
jgi:hypothetical protein